MSWRLSRRALLKGAGAAVALPWLEAMTPRAAHAQEAGGPPKRFLAWFAPNGIFMPAWTPESEGALTASPILEPLGDLLADCLLLTGLENRPGIPEGGAGDHFTGTASFMTGVHVRKTEGTDISNAKSADQVIADQVGGRSRFHSLQLGMVGKRRTGRCADQGYSCAYSNNVSWSGPATPLHKERRPRALYDRLFAGVDAQATAEQIERRRLGRLSILDFVRGDAERLQGRLGTADRAKLDAYLTSLREFERRLEDFKEPLQCRGPARPENTDSIAERCSLMSQLIAIAFRCDLTRVVSFMLGNGGTNASYPWLGFGDGHHLLSHHMDDPGTQERYVRVCAWEMELLAEVLQLLKDSPEGEDGGSVLDNTLVYFSSDVEDGATHSHLNLPILLAGGAGGAVTPGRHVVYEGGPSLSNLLLAMVRIFGVDADRFGDDSTGPLKGLA